MKFTYVAYNISAAVSWRCFSCRNNYKSVFLLRTNLSFSQNVCIDSLISYTDTTPWCVQSVSHDTPGILLTLLEEEFDIQQFSVIFEATDAHAVGGWVGLVHKIPQPNSSCVCVLALSVWTGLVPSHSTANPPSSRCGARRPLPLLPSCQSLWWGHFK